MSPRSKTRTMLISAAMALVAFLLGVPPAQAAAGRPTTTTTVLHGLTETEFFPDDICGSRASDVVFTIRTQVIHLTERDDGSFNFTFTETGTYHVDFLDPALADQDSQFTEAIHVTLTPGGTFVASVAFHDFPTGIRIWERFHLTEVDGRPVVERDIQKVTGCP